MPARGYYPIELSSVLFRPIQPGLRLTASRDNSIHVREIEFGEHDLWAAVSARSWADVFPEIQEYLVDIGRLNPHRSNAHFFVAEKEGQAIAAGTVCFCEGVAVLAGACTVPEWRKQGAQLALLEHRLCWAVENGCDLAMIVTQPGSGSQRNAERHGFRVAYTRIKWRLELGRIGIGASGDS